MTVTPQMPEPLPANWLRQRESSERKWEINSRASETQLKDAQRWAKKQLTDIFIAKDLGGDANDPDFMRRVDEMYDTIRNAFTRQDLILGFLLVVQAEAAEDANYQMEGFRRELRGMIGPEGV